jgi:hypothetical protein
MSAYFNEDGEQVYFDQQNDPLRQAYEQDPVAVITAAATLAAQNAAAEVGQTVYAARDYQRQQDMNAAAQTADAALTERYGSDWELNKAAYADEFISQRPGFISDQELFDPVALTDTLAAGYRAWRGAKTEEVDRVQKMEQKEFADSLIALHRDSSYAAKMASNGFRDALDDVQG